jgi:hypothetical protein
VKLARPRYFTAPDGARYRVLDSAWRAGKRLVANPPASQIAVGYVQVCTERTDDDRCSDDAACSMPAP